VHEGTRILDELFPDLVEEMVVGGLPMIQDLTELRFAPGGHPLLLTGRPEQPFICQSSRSYLEGHLQARVRALPGVEIIDNCASIGPIASPSGDRVTGVRILPRADGSVEQSIDTDLVVDATGRGSRMPAWLETIGYPKPQEEKLEIQLKYASRHLRLRPGALDGRKVVAMGAQPARPTGFVLAAQEGDRWILTAIGYDNHHPPTDPTGFLAFVEAIAPPDIVAAIRAAEPLDDIVAHRFPANVRRRYDKLPRFPVGLLVFGDAICSLNPSYALGMSVAMQQAKALRDSLNDGDRHLARRFFRAASKSVDRAWMITVGGDLALPQIRGRRPVSVRIVNAYLNRVMTAAERDTVLAERFFRVAGLQDPPARMFRLDTAFRTLADGRRRSRREQVRGFKIKS
jgi:2-polyprenyl-6-methoxyphenol hydroxylase-like FAD-dependent oxidoreductase